MMNENIGNPESENPIVDVIPKPPFPKRYIGDGVYVAFDGYHLVLTTENGISITNTIALEPGLLELINLYDKELREYYA